MTSPSETSPVGVVGLGLLGSALADRMLDAGFEVLCWNRSPEKVQPLLERGARWSDNPLAECERVVVCLYTADVTRETFARMQEGLRPGQLVIDSTTGGVEDAQRMGAWLAERGAEYLEAPIAASSEQTRRGEATALVGGPASAFERARPLLNAMTAASHYVGEWGSAAAFKLVNNLILGINRAALAEGLALAERLGLDLGRTLDVLQQCNSASGVMATKGPKMVARDYATQAKLAQHAKDVRLILEEAAATGLELPFSSTHLRVLQQGEQAGWGDWDNAAIFELLAHAPQGTP